jgi:hypothetical protein
VSVANSGESRNLVSKEDWKNFWTSSRDVCAGAHTGRSASRSATGAIEKRAELPIIWYLALGEGIFLIAEKAARILTQRNGSDSVAFPPCSSISPGCGSKSKSGEGAEHVLPHRHQPPQGRADHRGNRRRGSCATVWEQKVSHKTRD